MATTPTPITTMTPSSRRMTPELIQSILDLPPREFSNAAVEASFHSPALAMVPSELSRVLIIYTGGTVGMKNTPSHGYQPIPGFLTQTLKTNLHIHADPSCHILFCVATQREG